MLKLGRNGGGAFAAGRIKAWITDRFGAGEETWLVTEASCLEPGRPPRQTTLVMMHPAATVSFRILKPMDDVTEADIGAMGGVEASLAAEGCC